MQRRVTGQMDVSARMAPGTGTSTNAVLPKAAVRHNCKHQATASVAHEVMLREIPPHLQSHPNCPTGSPRPQDVSVIENRKTYAVGVASHEERYSA